MLNHEIQETHERYCFTAATMCRAEMPKWSTSSSGVPLRGISRTARRVTVNPSDDFDPDFQPYSITTGLEGDYENNAGPGENEIVEYINVPEGCYMIWSSAADFEGTGSYTIEVDEV